jgi:pimeloyl-ACP methyl ester carboxylesterase
MKAQQKDTRDQRGRHVIFLHGLFGSANSFRFLAKRREIQENFTVHILDMRNHGKSAWSN